MKRHNLGKNLMEFENSVKNCGEIVADKSPGVAQVGKKGTSRLTPAGFTGFPRISQTCVLVLVGKFQNTCCILDPRALSQNTCWALQLTT